MAVESSLWPAAGEADAQPQKEEEMAVGRDALPLAASIDYACLLFNNLINNDEA